MPARIMPRPPSGTKKTPYDHTKSYLASHNEIIPSLDAALNACVATEAEEPLKYMAEVLLVEAEKLRAAKQAPVDVSSPVGVRATTDELVGVESKQTVTDAPEPEALTDEQTRQRELDACSVEPKRLELDAAAALAPSAASVQATPAAVLDDVAPVPLEADAAVATPEATTAAPAAAETPEATAAVPEAAAAEVAPAPSAPAPPDAFTTATVVITTGQPEGATLAIRFD